MSDLFYPETVSTCKYNAWILKFIPQLRYSIELEPGSSMAVLYVAQPPTAKPSIVTTIPASYVGHVRRFLWRYYLFSYLYKFHEGSEYPCILNDPGIDFLERMLVMMDVVIGQLIMGCKKRGKDLLPTTRIQYFDYYLVTEFVVGRHDPLSVNAWREKQENKDLDLERMDPDTLDWASYDTTLGDIFNGKTYEYSPEKVKGKAEWIRLLEAVEKWYDMEIRIKQKAPKVGRMKGAGTTGMGANLLLGREEEKVGGDKRNTSLTL